MTRTAEQVLEMWADTRRKALDSGVEWSAEYMLMGFVECYDALAGISPEAVREMREALKECADVLEGLLEDLGGCDHSVGICNCDLERTLDRSRAALAALEEQP